MDITLLYPILSLIVTTAVTSIIGVVINRLVSKRFNKQDQLIKAQEELRALKKQEEDRKATEDLMKKINECLAPVNKKIESMEKMLELNTTGTVMLLREAMLQEHNRLIKQKKITQHELHRWLDLYSAYKNLGGNHFAEYVNGWKDNIENLPIDVVGEG